MRAFFLGAALAFYVTRAAYRLRGLWWETLLASDVEKWGTTGWKWDD